MRAARSQPLRSPPVGRNPFGRMSLRVFNYTGKEAGRHGIQRGRAGDECFDDERGKGILDNVDGAHVLVEFGASGEAKQIESRPCAGVYMIKNREALPASVPTGRSGKSSSARISTFFVGGPSAIPPPPAAKARAARGGAFKAPSGGRGRGNGSSSRAVGASSSSSTPSTLGAKDPSKRPRSAETPDATTTSETGGEEGAVDSGGPGKRAKAVAFEIGAEHAEEEAEEEAGSSKASGQKASAHTVNYKVKSAEEKAQYKHDKYEEKKTVAVRLEPSHPLS